MIKVTFIYVFTKNNVSKYVWASRESLEGPDGLPLLYWENWISKVSIAAPCWWGASAQALKQQNFQDLWLSACKVKRVKGLFTQNRLVKLGMRSLTDQLKRKGMYLLWLVSPKLDFLGGGGVFRDLFWSHKVIKVINQQYDGQLCCLIRAKICLFVHWEHQQIITCTSGKVLGEFLKQI